MLGKEGNPQRSTQRADALQSHLFHNLQPPTTHGYLHLTKYETTLKFSPSVSLALCQCSIASVASGYYIGHCRWRAFPLLLKVLLDCTAIRHSDQWKHGIIPIFLPLICNVFIIFKVSNCMDLVFLQLYWLSYFCSNITQLVVSQTPACFSLRIEMKNSFLG